MAKLHFVVERGHGTSTSMNPEWCGGARRPAWHLERGCPRTPWRIFGNISIRRKPAATSVAWVASGRRLRSISGARSGALLTALSQRLHYELPHKLLARPAHQFTRLNDSSGLSALLRNFFLACDRRTRGCHFRVCFELRRHFRVFPFPVFGGRSSAHAASPEKGARLVYLSEKQYQIQAQPVKKLSVFGSSAGGSTRLLHEGARALYVLMRSDSAGASLILQYSSGFNPYARGHR
jgi:hypothetical protein